MNREIELYIMGIARGVELMIEELLSPYRKIWEYIKKDTEFNKTIASIVYSVIESIGEDVIGMYESIKMEKKLLKLGKKARSER